jgi:hypothetical protein
VQENLAHHARQREVRLGKKPTYLQVAEPALPLQQMRIKSVSLPAADPSTKKKDALAEALKQIVALIATM